MISTMRLLFVDSSLAGESKGYLTPKRWLGLKRQLEQGGDKPTAVFMHHPPVKAWFGADGRISCENGDQLLALIDRFPSLCSRFLWSHPPADFHPVSSGDHHYHSRHGASGALLSSESGTVL